MIRCQECNSQVAEQDLFCPFCGARVVLDADVAAPADDGSADEAVDDVNSEATTEPDVENIPTPDLLVDHSKTAGNISAGPTSEFSIPRSDEFPAAIETDDTREDPDDNTQEDSEEEADDVSVDEPAEAAVAASAGEPHDPSAEPSDIFEERSVYEDHGISKPIHELEQSDPYASRSMFDSVRIMESKPDDIDTRLQIDPGPLPDASAPPVQKETTNVEPKPYTEPNMGLGGDTDGKRSKLKPLTEGTVLNGRYEIVRKIGGGGMGAVYLASDNNLGGVLRAVKEMVQSHIEEEQQEKAINDFKRESMILSTLDHPSIPTIYDYFYDSDECRFYLVMKYISGGDLASRLRSAPEGRIDEKSTTQWAIEITDVLNYLHSQPSTIVYRDLKPSNIMVDGNTGRIMLVDFGIARSIGQKEEKGVTAVGTMGYAPPELFSGNVEPRSDIYSLGSTMFHLLTGADPQSNPLLIFDFQKNPRPRQINSQLSDQIERIMMRAVEYNADMRFASAAEMKSVLEEHLASLGLGNVSYGVSAVPASISLENQTVFCGFCGQRIVATDLFCAFCGAKQPIAQQGVHSEIYSRSVPTARLIIEGTSELSTPAFSLQKEENLVGRRDPMSNIFPEIDLSKYDPQTKISRRHARIWREGENFLVEDLGSSNGTILASTITDSLRLVPHKPHLLSSGDKLKVGDTTLHFVVG
jgi:serine/threonine-protein kinase